MLVAFIASSSPLPGGSSSSTTATPPSVLRTAFIVLLVRLFHYHAGDGATHLARDPHCQMDILSGTSHGGSDDGAVHADPACVP